MHCQCLQSLSSFDCFFAGCIYKVTMTTMYMHIRMYIVQRTHDVVCSCPCNAHNFTFCSCAREISQDKRVKSKVKKQRHKRLGNVTCNAKQYGLRTWLFEWQVCLCVQVFELQFTFHRHSARRFIVRTSNKIMLHLK